MSPKSQGYDGTGFPGNCALNRLHRDLAVLIDIHQDWSSSKMRHHVSGRAERKCRHNHFVTRANAQTSQRDMQCRSAGIHSDCVTAAHVLGKFFLKLGNLRTRCDPTGSKAIDHLIDFFLTNGR
jgi:hypothetical protein